MNIATKEEERNALEAIQKIVADLGPDSYLSVSFQGVWAIAEENIANDSAVSAFARAAALEEDAEERLKAAAIKTQEVEKTLLKAKELEKRFNLDRNYWEDIRKSLDWAAYQLSDKLGY